MVANIDGWMREWRGGACAPLDLSRRRASDNDTLIVQSQVFFVSSSILSEVEQSSYISCIVIVFIRAISAEVGDMCTFFVIVLVRTFVCDTTFVMYKI